MPRKSFLRAALVTTMLATPITAAADAALDAALYDIGRAESQASSLSPAKIKRITMMIENAETSLDRSQAKGTEAYEDAETRLETLKAMLAGGAAANTTERPQPDPATLLAAAELESLGRRVGSAWQQMQLMGQGDWLRPDMVDRWETEISGLEQLAANTAHIRGPEADEIRGQVIFLRQFFGAALQVASRDQGAIEAEWAAYQEIENWVHKVRVPAAPDKPNADNVANWLSDIAAYRLAVEKHRGTVGTMTATHPNLAQSMIDGLNSKLTAGVDQQIARQAELLVANLTATFTNVNWLMGRIAEADPEDQGIRWNLLTGQKADWARRDLDNALVAVSLLADVQKGVGLAVTDNSAQATAIAAAIATFETKQLATIAYVRFPETRVQNDAYLNAALAALDKIDTGTILRAAITSEVTKHNRSEGRADFGGVVVEITVSDYVWEEFQVTTAEETHDGIRLYVNTLKFFHQGGSDVPVGRWVMGERRPSTPILPEHVNS